MKAIFGLQISSTTVLSVQATVGGDATPVMTIQRRGGATRNLPSPGSWSVSLEPGDYAVQVDDAVEGPVQVSLSRSLIVVTTLVRGGPIALLAAFAAQHFATSDPKDPWPPALAPDPIKLQPVSDKWFASVLLPIANPSSRGAAAVDLHALLIGIDHYPASGGRSLYRSCRGGVGDVLEVAAYLDELGVPTDQITCLTSPAPGSADPGAAPPTYDAITAAWRRLADEVPAGAQVYIHYAGHGGRARTHFPDAKGAAGVDEVLVPCDINDRATGRYLRDVEVAHLLERMSERGLAVTLVVDSCNAGGITRGEAGARTGLEADLDPRAADQRASAVASQAELDGTARRVATAVGARRDAGWFFGASPHVLVAACRQNEVAHELAFDGASVRGALTTFWLEALRQSGARASYRAVHQRLTVALHAHFRDQTPVLVGDGDRIVFGTDHLPRPRTIAVSARDGRFELAAGQAHGLRVGSRLALLPAGALPELVDLGAMPVVEVDAVEPTTSTARLVAGSPAPSEPSAGLEAIPLRRGASAARRVRLVPPPATRQLDRAPTAASPLAEVERAIATAGSDLIGLAGTDGADLVVTASEELEPVYRVTDAAGREIPNLGPPLEVGDPRSAAELTRRLVHLARFTSVHTLSNLGPRAPLAGRLGLELLLLPPTYQEGDEVRPVAMAAGEAFRVAAGRWFCVRLENRAAVDLHVAVLDLQPDWGIARLIPSDASTVQLAPGQILDTVVQAWLPDGVDGGTDVLKAIATVAPTDYEWLLLDPLAAAVDRPGAPTRHVQQAPSSRWTTEMREMIVSRG